MLHEVSERARTWSRLVAVPAGDLEVSPDH